MSLSTAQPVALDIALGRLVKGVYLFAIQDAGGPALTPGTALINFSREPATLLWSLETGSSLYSRLTEDAWVAVNMLAADQAEWLHHCAGSKGAERFGRGSWHYPAAGDHSLAPWLAEAEVVLQCRVAETWIYQGQAAIVLTVEAARAAAAANPMCYAGGRFGRWSD